MFTGIIQHIGTFRGYPQGNKEVKIEAPAASSAMKTGDSLAINGVCLSLIRMEKTMLHFDLSEETLKNTTLGSLQYGQSLNLELPLTLASPLGGHLITGHIDGIGRITHSLTRSQGQRFHISFPTELRPFFVPKGSVALDGVSLTVASLHGSTLEVEVLPITLKHTTLSEWKHGRTVNVECDLVGKYVYNWTFKKSNPDRKDF
ncbi:MAG: riboflavin synthase [Candidatus Aminicenantes bacterium]|nr:riboflavin synthase [Candidatus Aminicenantes bacterium]